MKHVLIVLLVLLSICSFSQELPLEQAIQLIAEDDIPDLRNHWISIDYKEKKCKELLAYHSNSNVSSSVQTAINSGSYCAIFLPKQDLFFLNAEHFLEVVEYQSQNGEARLKLNLFFPDNPNPLGLNLTWVKKGNNWKVKNR